MGSMSNRLTWFGNGQNRRAMFRGTYNFTTTSATKSVTVPLRTIESVHVRPIGTPGKAYRQISRQFGTLSATSAFNVILPPYAGTLIAAQLTLTTTVAVHDDNHWTFTLVNKGAAGAGTANLIAATSANSTDQNASPAGSALTASVVRSLVLGSASDLIFAASDVALFTATKAASASNLVGLELNLVCDCADVGEQLTINNTISGTSGTDDARIVGSNGATTLVVTRNATNPTSGMKFFIEAIGY